MQKEEKVMQEPSWELSDTQPELEHQDWEKEFDKEFCQNGQEVATYSKMSMSGIAITNEVKSFIRSLLASQKQEVIEIAEGTKKHKHLDNCNLQEISPEKCGWCLASNLHYNQALQDLINKLK
jgi:hypothetical protein